MKIVHLNTASTGGAGRACFRLNKALIDQGIDSQVWINDPLDKNADYANFSAGFFQKYITAIGIILETLVSKYYTKASRIPFSFPLWGRNITQQAALQEADIIHLHWINRAFLRPIDLSKLAQLNKPIVWTFHDSNAFTGGCHVRYACTHYQQACGCCPVLRNPHPQDWSHQIWKAKQQAYRDLNFQIIAPSKWMASSIKKSSLLASHPVEIIPNTLDLTKFTPSPKQDARRSLGISPDRFILMSGLMPSKKDLHKGTSYLMEAIRLFITYDGIDPAKIELLFFGNRNENMLQDLGIKTTFLGVLSDDTALAQCYSSADIFLAPSLEDNLPNTVMESLACGTPVVAFTTGGIPDMVLHQENGYLAEYTSSANFAKGIHWIYQHPAKTQLNHAARQMAENHFAEETIAQKHITLYRKALLGYV